MGKRRSYVGLLWWLSGRVSTGQYSRHQFDPWSRMNPHDPAATWTANAPRPHRAAGTEGSGRLELPGRVHSDCCFYRDRGAWWAAVYGVA